MKEKPVLSLCIPTNGIVEWVIPVLDSIYKQQVDLTKYEVVVTDNGNNSAFQDEIRHYVKRYSNLVYKKTNAIMFENQIEAFRLAKGNLIKFVNHRMMMCDGAVQYFIDIAEKYADKQPDIYFSNGALSLADTVEFANFNDYVAGLLHYSSWSAGLAMWDTDLESIPTEIEYDKLFPHITLLFWRREKDMYIINDQKYGQDIEIDNKKKGRYNLFYAFGVHYMSIILKLLESKRITNDTYIKIKKENEKFLVSLYYDFIIKKNPCSYILDNYDKNLSIFYDYKTIKRKCINYGFKKNVFRVKRLLARLFIRK